MDVGDGMKIFQTDEARICLKFQEMMESISSAGNRQKLQREKSTVLQTMA